MDIDKLSKKLNRRGESQGLQLLRRQALERFRNLTWPPQRQSESWKYSPLKRLQTDFELVSPSEQPTYSQSEISDWIKIWSHPSFSTICIYNGQVIHQDPLLKESIDILSFKIAMEKGLVNPAEYFGVENPLQILNWALLNDGLFINVPADIKLNKTVHCLFLYDGAEENSYFQNTLFVHASERSTLSIYESHTLLDPSKVSWCNTLSEINLDSDAQVEYIQWSENLPSHQITQNINAKLGPQARLQYFQGGLTQGWLRSQSHFKLEGQNSEIVANSSHLTSKEGVSETISKIYFGEPESRARQHCKNILLDQSRAVFNGCISISNKAQKTEASQLHQSLLLSEGSEVDTKPELEIFADDVKAKHGATIGQLNPEELFYFQSRGISKNRARHLLCTAFIKELCDHISDLNLRGFLKARIDSYWMKENL